MEEVEEVEELEQDTEGIGVTNEGGEGAFVSDGGEEDEEEE